MAATLKRIYGKRIIIMGGGAQVGQVAIGAISEADRHNIRGEQISVDTIPLVGEQALAEAVRAVSRLPRARALVLAGSLMGGEIEDAVREVRAQGLLVISLNMAGSVPDAADLVVTDPVQAGVMAVMAVADTARFTIERLKRRVFMSVVRLRRRRLRRGSLRRSQRQRERRRCRAFAARRTARRAPDDDPHRVGRPRPGCNARSGVARRSRLIAGRPTRATWRLTRRPAISRRSGRNDRRRRCALPAPP